VSARSVSRPLLAGVGLIALACCPFVEQQTRALRPVAAISPVVAPQPKAQPLQAVSGTGLLKEPERQVAKPPSVVAAGKKAAKPTSAKATATATPASGLTGQLDLTGEDLTASSAAEVALSFALDQLGKPYVWGAEGPDTYDCSGLTMRAYEAAGYEIPRVAADQALVGTPVDVADLLPGDLLFYATDPSDLSTIHHVVMYAGAGLIVHAPHTGDVVRLGPMWLGDEYVGAVRIVDAKPASLVGLTSDGAVDPTPGASASEDGKPTAPHPTKSPVPRPSHPGSPGPTPSSPTPSPVTSPILTWLNPTQSPTVGPTDVPTPAVTPSASPRPTPSTPSTEPTTVPFIVPVTPTKTPTPTPSPSAGGQGRLVDSAVSDPVVVRGF
jgi:cell wall-associated NlpC family hydrolase